MFRCEWQALNPTKNCTTLPKEDDAFDSIWYAKCCGFSPFLPTNRAYRHNSLLVSNCLDNTVSFCLYSYLVNCQMIKVLQMYIYINVLRVCVYVWVLVFLCVKRICLFAVFLFKFLLLFVFISCVFLRVLISIETISSHG